jgi:hypothetical protein
MLDGFHETSFAKLADNETITATWTFATPFEINDSDDSHQYVLAVSNLAADRTITLPLLTGNDTFVFESHAQTLSNKTLASPIVTTGAIDLQSGQIKFPAAQSASSNVNTLDDYEEGTWTPVLTFATPGNVAVTYSNQAGGYTKIGNLILASFCVITSAFTHTTASGNIQLTGLPFAAGNVASNFHYGALQWSGITKAGYTSVVSRIDPNTAIVIFIASASAAVSSLVVAADTPSGGTINFTGIIMYRTAT